MNPEATGELLRGVEDSQSARAPRSWRWEPHRVFWPVGVLIAISGVSLWPLSFTGIHKFYPGLMHARMMIEGAALAFVLGGYATALRRSDEAAWSRVDLWWWLLLLLTCTGLHIAHLHLPGDWCFLFLVLDFARQAVKRLSAPAAASGFAAIFGVLLLISFETAGQKPELVQLGRLLLYQGFPLCALLSTLRPGQAARGDGGAWWVGAAIVLSLGLEAFSRWTGLALILRAAATGFWIWRSAWPLALKAMIIATGLGWLFPEIWLGQRIAGLHLLFLGGFATAAVWLATQGRPAWRWAAPSLLAATVLRVGGDFAGEHRIAWLNASAYLWMAVMAIWAWLVFRRSKATPPKGAEEKRSAEAE